MQSFFKLLTILARCVLILLGLIVAASATNDYSKENFGIRYYYTDDLKWRNDWYHGNNPLQKSSLLIKSVIKIIKNEAKEQKDGFRRMLLGTLGASLLGNLLTGESTF